MKLVIGGAFQGKKAWAEETYQIREGWADGQSCADTEIFTCRGIDHFHEYVRRFLMPAAADETAAAPAKSDGEDLCEMESRAEDFAGELYRQNPDIVLISNEMGCGVVPVNPADRDFRETLGRVCTCLAAQADEVTRVVCGIGVCIKQSKEKEDAFPGLS